mmetsp:Transcript_12766/g.51315  ORF Transcript_12766/g.51315 Transcript_12766/m.51315 type:complete len:200 (+) Transcript_12766:4259-4858(+)
MACWIGGSTWSGGAGFIDSRCSILRSRARSATSSTRANWLSVLSLTYPVRSKYSPSANPNSFGWRRLSRCTFSSTLPSGASTALYSGSYQSSSFSNHEAPASAMMSSRVQSRSPPAFRDWSSKSRSRSSMRLRISVAASIHMFAGSSPSSSFSSTFAASEPSSRLAPLRVTAARRWSGVMETPRSSASSSAQARPTKPG